RPTRADQYRALLTCIFSYDWKSDRKVSVSAIHLISQIVSTNATFLGRAFQLYVKSLLPIMTTTLSAETADPLAAEKQNLIHRAIQTTLNQVPTGRSVFFPILVEHFPHKRFSRNVQTEYIAQLLRICAYEPMLQARLLQLIITKCLEMDVEIVIEDSGEVRIDAEDDGDGEDIFQIDEKPKPKADVRRMGGPGSIGAYGSLTGRTILSRTITVAKPITAAATAVMRIPLEVAEMADKLDTMLVLLVTFCREQIQLSAEASERLLQQLLSIFESSILTIHKSKFVQFCVFFSASLNARFAEAVGEKLMGILLDQRASSSQRQSAVMYLSSYLSRSAFLPSEYIGGQVRGLIKWASEYVDRKGDSPPTVEYDEFGRACVRPQIGAHELFYCVVQSACYVLCFHGVKMALEQREVRGHWENTVSSMYDPLRVCLRSVRVEFVKLASGVGMLSNLCWNSLSADLLTDVENPSQNPSHDSTATFTTADSSVNTLDSFFPFDPCLLCKLHQVVQRGYRDWEGVPGLEDLNNSDADSDSDGEDGSDARLGGAGAGVGVGRSDAGAGAGVRGDVQRSPPVSMPPQDFDTSSLSSVVSSLACTDGAMSVGSAHYVGISPFSPSKMRLMEQERDQEGEGGAGGGLGRGEPLPLPQGNAGRGQSLHQSLQHQKEQSVSSQQQEEKEQEEDSDDDGVHETHMHVPVHEIMGPGPRRPRFYSIGSTGSW
ncbi:RNA polymerase I-specific transcription initiation factor RRN3-domain-containing protein, partial [Ochromonadaceae sp. CCMP2298]